MSVPDGEGASCRREEKGEMGLEEGVKLID